jgi:hypothetical protein
VNDVIPFKSKAQRAHESELKRLVKISDEVDSIILHHIRQGEDIRDLAGILAHRLGNLLRHADPVLRDELTQVIKGIVEKQSSVDNARVDSL